MLTPLTFGPFSTSLIELIAVLFGLVSVWSMKKESILAFPFGIVNVLIYSYICFETKLYAYAGINLFFAFMSVYGWFNWVKEKEGGDKIVITNCSSSERILYGVALLSFFTILWFGLEKFTDSVVPFWDGLTTAIYIIAMWFLARKKLENWIAWILGDIISIGLFAYEGLLFSSFQYLVFTIIAVFGYMEWRSKLKAVVSSK
jgi:nicotinamide mononucleotide transporter